jgi:hypothetical protein
LIVREYRSGIGPDAIDRYLRAMSPAPIAPPPRELFFALLSSGASAHTGFLVVLTWMRPDLGTGAIIGLLILPFLFITLGFVPVILVLALGRIVLARAFARFAVGTLGLVAILSIVGIALACGIAVLTTGWIHDDEIVSSVLFGAAVGGVIAGLKIGSEPKEKRSLL